MHIGAAVPLYPPSSRVGAWLATSRFLEGAVAAGHQVDVCVLAGREKDMYELNGVRVWPGMHRKNMVRKCDVVISHLGDSGQVHRYAVKCNTPSVRMFHGGTPKLSDLDGAALAVCNSQASAAMIQKWKGRTVVCNPPTDVSEFTTTPGDMITLVNLSFDKGGETFWHLAESNPSLRFLGVTGFYGTQVKGSAVNAEVIPPTTNMRDDVYARTRVLLMPSKHEAWGMTAVEAMASGIPVLSSKAPGLLEAVGSAANVPATDDFDGWNDALADLLRPKQWSAASKRAKRRVGELDPAKSIQTFIAELERLA